MKMKTFRLLVGIELSEGVMNKTFLTSLEG